MWSKRCILCISIFSCVVVGNAAQGYIDHYFSEVSQGEVAYLLSYPRSGNSLVRYLIEFVTKRPTLAFQRTQDKINLPLGLCLKELKTDLSSKPVWKVHASQKIADQLYYAPEKTRVILVLRSYKENLFREAQVWRLDLFNTEGQLNETHLRAIFSWYCAHNRMSKYDPDFKHYGNTGAQLYFDNITFLDQLPAENKLLIYYEDLIQDPEKELYRICDFFGCSYEYIPVLMSDYGRYKKSILAFYPENKTTGSEKIHYSKKYSLEQRVQIDEYVKCHYPKVWDTYLQRYQEEG